MRKALREIAILGQKDPNWGLGAAPDQLLPVIERPTFMGERLKRISFTGFPSNWTTVQNID
jgi:hypothetical protein